MFSDATQLNAQFIVKKGNSTKAIAICFFISILKPIALSLNMETKIKALANKKNSGYILKIEP